VAEALSDTSIGLTLTPPAEVPASTNAGTGYSIEQSDDGTTGWAVIEFVAVGSQPSEVTGLAGSTTRHFRARSINSNPFPHDDGESEYSPIVNATTDAPVPLSLVGTTTITEVATLTLVGTATITEI
jgi:hypothetical protein